MTEARERFGFRLNPDNSILSFNPTIAVNEVSRHLVATFGYEPHQGAVLNLETVKGKDIMTRLLVLRGATSEDAELQPMLWRQNRAKATTIYAGDIADQLGLPVDYVVLVDKVDPLDFIPMMGEEILHGEHMAHHLRMGGMSSEDYCQAFHELDIEFLGYLGSHIIGAAADIRWDFNRVMEFLPENKRSLAHDITYAAVEKLGDRKFALPFRELFLAKNSSDFWNTVKESLIHGIRLRFEVAEGIDCNQISSIANNLLTEASADSVIELAFAYSDSALRTPAMSTAI